MNTRELPLALAGLRLHIPSRLLSHVPAALTCIQTLHRCEPAPQQSRPSTPHRASRRRRQQPFKKCSCAGASATNAGTGAT
jgi:hypothetical protein